MALVQITDVVVPEVFTPYIQQLTEEKTRLIQSGAAARSPVLDQLLAAKLGEVLRQPAVPQPPEARNARNPGDTRDAARRVS